MKRLNIIYNSAPTYREGIFKEIDKEWDCKWFFASSLEDIQSMDSSLLKNVTDTKLKKINGHWYWQKGAIRALRDKSCGQLLILGDIHALSTWWILFENYLFHRKKIFLWTHGWYGRESKIKAILKKIYFGLSTHIFPYGDYSKKIALKNGFHENKLSPVHNSLDYEEHLKIRESLVKTNIYRNHFENKYPTIFFIGRLTKVKRLDLLIKAIYNLKKENININLCLVGEGEDKENLLHLTENLGLIERIWFYGKSYNDHETAGLIYESDLCVSPGNVGLTAIHCMTFGTPVISHNKFSMQMPEFEAIITNQTGDFFEYDNIESLGQTIKSWMLNNNYRREEIRKLCYQQIDRYWNPYFQMNVFRSIIN